MTGSSNTADGATHAFLWDGTRMQDLGTLGGTSSVGHAINDSGQVTGFADTADGDPHAFLWDGTTMQQIIASPSFALWRSTSAATGGVT